MERMGRNKDKQKTKQGVNSSLLYRPHSVPSSFPLCRDTHAYHSIESGHHLVPWNGANDVVFNRYDARHLLDPISLSLFGLFVYCPFFSHTYHHTPIHPSSINQSINTHSLNHTRPYTRSYQNTHPYIPIYTHSFSPLFLCRKVLVFIY